MTNREILAKSERGMSMIEAIIYLALASFLVAGVIVSSYPLFTNTERQTLSTVRDLDAAFVTQKILLILNSATSISTPTVGNAGVTLSVVTASGNVSVSQTSGAVTVDRGAGAVPLTSSWVTVSYLNFSRVAGTGGAPDTISFDFTMNGSAVPIVTRYVKN